MYEKEHEKIERLLENISNDLQWLSEQQVNTHFIEPGSPWQNGYGESFNAILRDDCLNRWAFYSVKEAQVVANKKRKKQIFDYIYS